MANKFFYKKNIERKPILPDVTIIITAYNEAGRIRQKIENVLILEYHKNKLQIIVSSDAPTDETDNIVKNYKRHQVELIALNERKGKEGSQKEALKFSKGEITIFSDVATIFDSNALRRIVSNFADPSIGYVSSEDRLIDNNGKPAGEGYMCAMRCG